MPREPDPRRIVECTRPNDRHGWAMLRERTSRVPQSGKNMHSTLRPLSEVRTHVRGAPCVNENASRGTSIDVPNALPDCRWHSVQ